MRIEPCTSPDCPGWLELRQALWPDCSRQDHLAEMAQFCAEPERYGQFLARSEQQGQAAGFAEVSLRKDYVNGTESSPVAFLEGIYVIPAARHQGFARLLVQAAEQWAVAHGCRELASDAYLDNYASRAMHAALGFAETEQVVFFRKILAQR